ncbi:hypothetical protein ACFXTN_040727 [Malus domestica]
MPVYVNNFLCLPKLIKLSRKSSIFISQRDFLFEEKSIEIERGEFREPLLERNRRRNTTSQLAIVGAILSPIESLDYEIIENDLFKQNWRSRTKAEIFQYVCLNWALVLLIGLSTALVGFFNNLAVENIAGFKLLLTNNLMLQDKYYQAFAAFVCCNITLAAAAAALCAYIAPAAAGSGIPEVKAYLNGVDAHSILAPSTLFVKRPPIVGILTRHDFMPEHILELFPQLNPHE